MSALDDIWFESDLLRIGTFYCPPSFPHFHDTGPIENNLIVFPRTSVRITQAGKVPVVADPNVVMFYNKGQEYRRDKLSERGDLSDWIGFTPQFLLQVVCDWDEWVQDRPQRPFRFTHGPAHPQIYYRQRQIVHYLAMQARHEAGSADPLHVEEQVIGLFRQALRHAYRVHEGATAAQARETRRAHWDLIQDAKAFLARHFQQRLTLSQIAAAVFTSPYHLSRIFRDYTGSTIHTYLNQIRLHTSLELVAAPDLGLSEIALSLGYSSHSHFTHAFRRAFGQTPSQVRATASTRRVQQLRRQLV